MTEKTMTPAVARRKHTEAMKTVEAAQVALTDADTQLGAALVERSRLDAELDGGASIDAADLAAQIGANNTTTEALTRLRDRRRTALKEAQDEAETARRRIALAELLTLRDDIDSFDVDEKKARMLALVQEHYGDVLTRLYDFQDRLGKARQWSKEAQGLGVQVSPPQGFSSSSDVKVEGRALRTPEVPSYVVKWFDKLVDERKEAALEAGREENRRRIRDQHAAQHAHHKAQRDAMPTNGQLSQHHR